LDEGEKVIFPLTPALTPKAGGRGSKRMVIPDFFWGAHQTFNLKENGISEKMHKLSAFRQPQPDIQPRRAESPKDNYHESLNIQPA
jgi:hypothetical protein